MRMQNGLLCTKAKAGWIRPMSSVGAKGEESGGKER